MPGARARRRPFNEPPPGRSEGRPHRSAQHEGCLMTDAIVVLNAGSSSLKFSVFAGADDLPFVVGGQVSGLYTAAPRFVAKDGSGSAIAEKRWDADAALDHPGAIGHIVEWLRSTYGHA